VVRPPNATRERRQPFVLFSSLTNSNCALEIIQEQGEVLIKHLSTDSIPSGALTKPLHGAPFKPHTDVLMGSLPLQWISKAKAVVSKEGVCYDTAT
jgi:hypothetical protein